MTPKNRSVLRAFSILRVFHHEDEWVSVSEIGRRASLPFASTYRLLQTLEETGAVERAENGSYRLGYLIAALSQNVDIDDCLFKASRDLMIGLSRELNVSTFIGRMDAGMVTSVGRVLTPNSSGKFITVGSQHPAYSLALGRVMLADLSSEDLDEIMEEFELRPLTPHTTTNRSELISELAHVRRCGYAVEKEQTYLGMGCVAVPILDDEGRVMAAVAASEEVQKLTPPRIELLRNELMRITPFIKKKILPSNHLEAKVRKASRLPMLGAASATDKAAF
jgi:DNA-binding IclR family transcriptional regulator